MSMLILFVAIGFCSAMFTKLLDTTMDYGNIFDFVRFRIARLISSEFKETLNVAILKRNASMDFMGSLNEIREIYWMICTKHKWFTILNCIECMSIWVSFIFIGLSWMYFQYNPVYIPLIIASNTFFVRWNV